jgi:MFS family permease
MGGWRGRAAGLAADVTPLRVSPAYRRLWVGTTVSTAGTTMTAVVAIPVQVYGLTHSSLDLGLIGLVAFLPTVVFGLLGGSIADAVDRRVLALVTSSGLAATSTLLAIQAVLQLRLVWLLYLIVGVQAGLAAVDNPARSAIVPRLIPRQLLPAANNLQQMGFNLGYTTGPLIAGLLIKLVGLSAAYGVDAASFLATWYAVWRLPDVPPEGGGARAGMSSVMTGLRFLRHQPLVLTTFLIDTDAMLFGYLQPVLPVVARSFFRGGAGTVALLNWAYAMGAVLAAASGGWLTRIRRQGLAVLIAVAVFGGAVTGLGLVRVLWVGLVLFAVAGGADMVSAVFRNVMLQVITPDALRGRLSGVYTVVVTGGPRLGGLRAGAMAAATSPVVSVVGGGVILLGLLGVLGLAVPAFVRYDAHAPVGDASTQTART